MDALDRLKSVSENWLIYASNRKSMDKEIGIRCFDRSGDRENVNRVTIFLESNCHEKLAI